MARIRPGASSPRGAAHPKKEAAPVEEVLTTDAPVAEIIDSAPEAVLLEEEPSVEILLVDVAPSVLPQSISTDIASFVKSHFPAQVLTLLVGEDSLEVDAFGKVLLQHGCEVGRYDTALATLKATMEGAKDHALSMDTAVVLLGGYTPAGEVVPLKCITGGTKARLFADQIFLLKDNSLVTLKNRLGTEGIFPLPL